MYDIKALAQDVVIAEVRKLHADAAYTAANLRATVMFQDTEVLAIAEETARAWEYLLDLAYAENTAVIDDGGDS